MKLRLALFVKIVFAVISLVVLFAILQMRVVAANQGISLSLPQLYRLLLATQFYSLILPGPLAGGGVAWAKYVQYGADKGAAAAIVVSNRAIGLGITIVLGTCAWIVDRYGDRLILVVIVISIALFTELTFLSALWVLAALQVMLLLPITLAGIGIREVSLVGFGALVGIPSTVAIAWSFVILAGTIVVAALGGLIEANAATIKVESYLNGNRLRRLGRRDNR